MGSGGAFDVGVQFLRRFPGLTVLDAIGPIEVLSRLPGARVECVAPVAGLCASSDESVVLHAKRSLSEVEDCDILLVPGGWGAAELEHDPKCLADLRRLSARSRWTCSVCTGALLLGAAGLLEDLFATTHFCFLDRLAAYGARVERTRYLRSGKFWSAAGVSAGIDMALALAIEEIGEPAAQAIQLGIEYAPAPPIHAGSIDTAPPEIVHSVQERMARAIERRYAEFA